MLVFVCLHDIGLLNCLTCFSSVASVSTRLIVYLVGVCFIPVVVRVCKNSIYSFCRLCMAVTTCVAKLRWLSVHKGLILHGSKMVLKCCTDLRVLQASLFRDHLSYNPL